MKLKESKKEGSKLLNWVLSKTQDFECLGIENEWALVCVKTHEGWRLINQRNYGDGIARWCLGASEPFTSPIDGQVHQGEEYFQNHIKGGDAYLLLLKVSEDDLEELSDEDEIDPPDIDWGNKGKWGIKYLIAYRLDGTTDILNQGNNCVIIPSSESVASVSRKLFGFNVEDYRNEVVQWTKETFEDFGSAAEDPLKRIEGSERFSESAKRAIKQIIIEAGFPRKIDLPKLIETSDLSDKAKLELLTELGAKL